ncbi:MAG: GTPase HflX [Planctomycetes bacterium]|nr:GTPase HflX [Planctomycetota bacterium]MCB9887840.1 GTPase HflX [Planctomycetota bacterium]
MKNENIVNTRSGHGTEAILFGLVPMGDPRTAAEALNELQLLAETADFVPAGCMVQHRRHADPHTYLGSGKLDELAEVVRLAHSGAVICDDSLTPNQAKHIEAAIKVPCIDRSELILQIFGMHARSPQAKLQVELAALQYEMPRLRRRWTHLERQRGGIGVRGGAGEKQIDVDRNLIRTRISSVSREIKRIEQHKEREVAGRPDMFTIALVGYTNAGKSSLMNRLTEAGVLAENKLFSTLDTRTRPWRLPGGRTVLLTDTVGFLRKLPHQLVASFHATLQEALHADLLLVMVDGSSPEAAEQLHTVDEVLDSLDAGDLPRVTVLNKLDQVRDSSDLAPLWQIEPGAVAISVLRGDGMDDLHAAIQQHIAAVENRVEILLPHTSRYLLGEIRAKASVLSEFYTEEGCLMELQASPALLGRLLAEGARVAAADERAKAPAPNEPGTGDDRQPGGGA